MVEEGDRSRVPPGPGRPSASALIAAMWAERELGTPPPELVAPEPAAPASGSSRGVRTRSRVPVALLALAIAAVGGAGAYVVTRSGPRPSKAAFVAKADRICAGSPAVSRPTTYPQLKEAAAGVVAATDAELTRLDDAGRPGLLDRGRAQAMVDAIRATRRAAAAVEAAAAASNDGATVSAAQAMRVASADAKAKAKAGAYGVPGCAAAVGRNQDTLLGGANAVVKAGFLAKANGLCRVAVTTLAKVAPPGKDPTDLGRYLGEVIAPLETLAIGLRGLPVPPGDEVTLPEVLQAIDQANAAGRAMAAASLAQEPTRLAAASKEFVDQAHAAGAKLSAYGFGPCQYNT